MSRVLEICPELMIDSASAGGRTFYDLGSGTGRCIFLVSLLYNFRNVVGVELLRGLHSESERILRRFREEEAPLLKAPFPTQISLVRASFLDHDWSDADVVFANSTCFNDAVMEMLAKKAEFLRPGSIVITITKSLESKNFEVRLALSFTR